MTYPRLWCKHAPGALLLQTDGSVVKRIYFAVKKGKKTLAYVGQMFSFHHCRHVKTPKPQSDSVSVLCYKRIALK